MLSWLKPFKLNIIVLYTIPLNKINKFYLKFLWFQIPGILGSFTHYETNDRPNFVLRNLHTLISHSKVKNVRIQNKQTLYAAPHYERKALKDDICALFLV